MPNIVPLRPTPLVPIAELPVARSSNAWQAAALASNLLSLLLAAAMLLLAIRADVVFERQEAFAIELSKLVSSIAAMTSELVGLQAQAVDLQKSASVEDRRRLIGIEQEMVRLRAQIQIASRELATALKKRVSPPPSLPKLPPTPVNQDLQLPAGCFIGEPSGDIRPVFPCPPF